MEEILNEPRYRYAAIFGSALVAAYLIYSGFSDFRDAPVILKGFLFIVGCYAGAMQGYFVMVLFDRLRGRLR